MEYFATFGIDGALSHGFGLKQPDYVEKNNIIDSENNFKAFIEAAKIARNYSRTHLSNPQTEYTTVTILALHDSNKNLIAQREILKEKGYDNIRGFDWADDKLQVRCSELEHLLLLVNTQSNSESNLTKK